MLCVPRVVTQHTFTECLNPPLARLPRTHSLWVHACEEVHTCTSRSDTALPLLMGSEALIPPDQQGKAGLTLDEPNGPPAPYRVPSLSFPFPLALLHHEETDADALGLPTTRHGTSEALCCSLAVTAW